MPKGTPATARTYIQALDFTVSEQTVHIGPQRRRVDRAIWAGLERLPHEDEAPTITIEFVSRGRRNWQQDFRIKRDEYHSFGVREYWVIDRFERRMTVFRFVREKTTTKTVGQR
jgi:Uma2 family endonuclease